MEWKRERILAEIQLLAAISTNTLVEERKMTIKTNFRRLGKTLLVFCLPILLFIVILITSYYKTGEFRWSEPVSKSAIYFVLVCLVTLPGFLLHYHYYQHDKGKKLKFESTYIELSNHLQTTRVYIKDIQKVKIHSLLWSKRLPWISYGYSEVIFNNGESLKFSNLLIATISSEIYFVSRNTLVEKVEDFYTWIK
jgi:hypothetical protein